LGWRSGRPRVCVLPILKGKLGGMPWTILAATIDNWIETTYDGRTRQLNDPP
jgi:hypothetical protein